MVLRNDKDIDSKRTEYTQLYAPSTSWGNVVSMNLGYPGLRAYWPMTSISEVLEVRVYDISGQDRYLTCYFPD